MYIFQRHQKMTHERWIKMIKTVMCSIGGTRPSPSALFLSFSCSFRQISCQFNRFLTQIERLAPSPPSPHPSPSLPAPAGNWCLGCLENKEVSHWYTTSTKGTKPMFISGHSLLCKNSCQDRTCTGMNRTVILLLKIWNRTLSLG